MEQLSELGMVLIAHGSRREEANADLHQIVRRFRELGYTWTFPSFLELAEPTIVQAGEACVRAGAKKIVLAPYFLSAGVHVVEDIESARQELAALHPGVDFRRAQPLGPHPFLERILLQRAVEAAGMDE